MCYFMCQGQNPRWRPCLVTSQASSNATSVKCISSCLEDQRLSTESKIISKYCNLSKTQGKVPSNPWGYNLACRSESEEQIFLFYYNFFAIRIARGSAQMRLSSAFYRRNAAHTSLN